MYRYVQPSESSVLTEFWVHFSKLPSHFHSRLLGRHFWIHYVLHLIHRELFHDMHDDIHHGRSTISCTTNTDALQISEFWSCMFLPCTFGTNLATVTRVERIRNNSARDQRLMLQCSLHRKNFLGSCSHRFRIRTLLRRCMVSLFTCQYC